MVEKKLFINGEYVDSKGGKEFDVVDPSTEQVFGKAVNASSEDVDFAVQSARTAFNTTWGKMNANDKGRILFKFADLIE